MVMFNTDSLGPQKIHKSFYFTQIPQDLKRSRKVDVLHRFLRTLGDPEMVMFYTDSSGPQEIQKWLCFTQISQDLRRSRNGCFTQISQDLRRSRNGYVLHRFPNHMRSRNGCVSCRFFRTLGYTEMVMFYTDSLGPQGKLKING